MTSLYILFQRTNNNQIYINGIYTHNMVFNKQLQLSASDSSIEYIIRGPFNINNIPTNNFPLVLNSTNHQTIYHNNYNIPADNMANISSNSSNITNDNLTNNINLIDL